MASSRVQSLVAFGKDTDFTFVSSMVHLDHRLGAA
jgi:hypothetical protein